MDGHTTVRKIASIPGRILQKLARFLPFFRFIDETRETQTPITWDMWFEQHVRGINFGPYWPVHRSSQVVGWRNILAGVETSPGYMPGCYIQAIGKIAIGDYTQIGPGVGLISSNHDPTDLRAHDAQDIAIGAYSWIGMHAVILPGVTLGDFTIVGAGAIVTKSFPQGYCVLAGNPARVVKTLDPANCPRHVSAFEYHGYIPKNRFDAFRRANLKV